MTLRGVLLVVVTLAYPALVYLALGRLQPRWIAVLLLVIALARLGRGWRDPMALAVIVAASALAVLTGWSNAELPILLYPVLMNLLMLALFGASLRWPPSMIERFARLREPHLPDAAIAYTRHVTRVWCGFFVVNGAIALWTALAADRATWALYNGLIAYLLMGALMAGEWLLRQRVRAAHG